MGNIEVDDDTSFPFMILDFSLQPAKKQQHQGGDSSESSKQSKYSMGVHRAQGGRGGKGPPSLFSSSASSAGWKPLPLNVIVCHDVMDTMERMEKTLAPLVARHPGLQVLLWNYPGQVRYAFPLLSCDFDAVTFDL